MCLGCSAVLTFKKMVCSNFGELSNAQCSLHGIWCIMFNVNFDGARGGGCPSLQALMGMSSKVRHHPQAGGNNQQCALLSLVRCSHLNTSMPDPQGDAPSCLLLCLLLQTKLQPWWVCGSKAWSNLSSLDGNRKGRRRMRVVAEQDKLPNPSHLQPCPVPCKSLNPSVKTTL